MTSLARGFTSDVIALMHSGKPMDREKVMKEAKDERRELGAFLRDGMLAALAPAMEKAPGFVQQVMARALLEHVDWNLVAKDFASVSN